MNNNLKKLLRFIGIFFCLLIILNLLYNFYLNQFQNIADGITIFVSLRAAELLQLFGYDAVAYIPQTGVEEVWFYLDKKADVRIIEGCNGIAVIIMFLSLHFAFFYKLIPNLVYAVLGTGILFTINVLRLSLLALAYRFLPNWADFIHDVLFPLSIYGTMIALWIIWIFYYSKKVKN